MKTRDIKIVFYFSVDSKFDNILTRCGRGRRRLHPPTVRESMFFFLALTNYRQFPEEKILMTLLNTTTHLKANWLSRTLWKKKSAQVLRHFRVILAEYGFRKRRSTAEKKGRGTKGHSLRNASSTRRKPVTRRHFSPRLPETELAFRGQMALEFVRNSSRRSVGFPERRSNTSRTFDVALTETFPEWDARLFCRNSAANDDARWSSSCLANRRRRSSGLVGDPRDTYPISRTIYFFKTMLNVDRESLFITFLLFFSTNTHVIYNY